MPFSGSSIHVKPVAEGSLAKTESARKRSVPSDKELAEYRWSPFIVTCTVRCCLTSSESTVTAMTPGINSASWLATWASFSSRTSVFGMCSPTAEIRVSLAKSSGRRSAVGSSWSKRQACISRRTARAVGCDAELTPERTVCGDLRAGTFVGRPPTPPSPYSKRTGSDSCLVAMNGFVRLPGPNMKRLGSCFRWGNSKMRSDSLDGCARNSSFSIEIGSLLKESPLSRFSRKVNEYSRNVAVGRAGRSKSSTTSPDTIISTANSMNSWFGPFSRAKRLAKSEARPLVPRAKPAAFMIGIDDKLLKNKIASKRFDFPTPLGPAIHVNGPNFKSTFLRFLNPLTRSLVNMVLPVKRYQRRDATPCCRKLRAPYSLARFNSTDAFDGLSQSCCLSRRCSSIASP